MSGGFLEQMARGSAERVAQARSRVGDSELRARALASASPPRLVLHPQGFDLIAEVKLRSPAAGRLATAARDLTGRVEGYARAGAAAVSVLTEPARFDGSLDHLRSAAQALGALGVPAMRKDFLVDPYQVLEARAAGAGGVLVILRMLSERQTDALLDSARAMELFVLLEAFDEADIERAQAIVERRSAPAAPNRVNHAAVPGGTAAGDTAVAGTAAGDIAAPATLLVGLNCRDLDTLQVVPGRLESLAHRLPAGVPRVAESGVGSAADAANVAAAGYDLALVGSALMTGSDPAALAGDMLAAGRSAAAGRSTAVRTAPRKATDRCVADRRKG